MIHRRLSTFRSPWWAFLVIVAGSIRHLSRDLQTLYSLRNANVDPTSSSVSCGEGGSPILQPSSSSIRSDNDQGSVRGALTTEHEVTLSSDKGGRAHGENHENQTRPLPIIRGGNQPTPTKLQEVLIPKSSSGSSSPKNHTIHSTNDSALILAGEAKEQAKSKSEQQTHPQQGKSPIEEQGSVGSLSTKKLESEMAWFSSAAHDEEAACYVSIENKADYHYEIIESTIMQIPLPWEKIGCNTTRGPIHFDVALAVHDRLEQARGEREGWEKYFHEKLEGSIRRRDDGTFARIGSLVTYTNYTRDYSATVGISCDSYPFKKWLNRNEKGYCILHKECTDCAERHLDRTCYLTPMYNKSQCTFVPSHLPKFDNRPPPIPNVDLCISGGGGLSARRDYGLLADALARLQPQGVKVTLYQRVEAIPEQFHVANVTEYVQVNRVPGYVEFHEAVSKCHIILPLVGPTSGGREYFELKRLSGSIPVMTSHKLPAVIHTDFEAIYHDYLTAPVKVYNDTETFAVALHDMMDFVRTSAATSTERHKKEP